MNGPRPPAGQRVRYHSRMSARTRLGLHVTLFAATAISTMAVGAMQKGLDPFADVTRLLAGWEFSLTLMSILLIHEMGHYLMARRHRVDASLPYFIPAPSIIGTFGAFIRMRSPVGDRRALLDIGAAGPLAGFVASVPAIIAGLHYSEITGGAGVGSPAVIFGESPIFSFLVWLTLGDLPEGADVALHPVAFAGWVGMLVTFLNLLPVGQLDGGHIVYALFGARHRLISRLTLLSLLFLALASWQWIVWVALLLAMGTAHPSPLDGMTELDLKRKVVGAVACIVFLLTLTPVPFRWSA